jgi:hypothetical protein
MVTRLKVTRDEQGALAAKSGIEILVVWNDTLLRQFLFVLASPRD